MQPAKFESPVSQSPSAATNRRSFLQQSAVGAVTVGAGLALSGSRLAAQLPEAGDKKQVAPAPPTLIAMGPFKLPPLPYAYDALEPSIDALTMKIHHDKHHQAYVTNLNKALESAPEWSNKPLATLLTSLDKLPEAIRTAVRNNGGGHANHSLFWEVMGPKAGGEPSGKLADAINASFGSFAKFKELLSQAAMKQFGSGWAWLYVDKDGKLQVKGTPNQDTPAMDGLSPTLGLDVWEHAYYLKYQNLRADYVAAWWKVVNWKAVEEKFAAATKK